MSLSRLMGWVWMQRSGATLRRRTSSTSPLVARSKNAPSCLQHVDDRGMRQGLERVVKIDARQRRGERAVLRAHALGIDHEQAASRSGHQVLDRLAGERILRRIELQLGFVRQTPDSGSLGHSMPW